MYFSSKISVFQIRISGWRFKNNYRASRILTNVAFTRGLRRECSSKEPKRLEQDSYSRLSNATKTSDGTYVDCNNIVNFVSIRHFSAFIRIQVNLLICKDTLLPKS